MMIPPRRHRRSYGDDPPSGTEAVDEPLAAFPSWFLRITCDRRSEVRMVNEAHTPQRERPIRDVIARMRHGVRVGKGGAAHGIEGASSRPVWRIVVRQA